MLLLDFPTEFASFAGKFFFYGEERWMAAVVWHQSDKMKYTFRIHLLFVVDQQNTYTHSIYLVDKSTRKSRKKKSESESERQGPNENNVCGVRQLCTKRDNFYSIVAVVSCHNMFLMIMNHPLSFFLAHTHWKF